MNSLTHSPQSHVMARLLMRVRHWLRRHGLQRNFVGYEGDAVGTVADFPLFDTDWYLTQYPDVALEGLDPKVHFKRHGRFEGRTPSAYFDTNYYIETYLNGSLDVDPLEHYLTEGWRNGNSPIPYFSTNWYLSNNADVADAGIEPLSHYIQFGWKEGRTPSVYFDVEYYLATNLDVRASGLEPLLHFIGYGRHEKGRNPNPYFDSHWYSAQYLEEDKDRQHPLLHYIEKGAKLGFSPGANFDRDYYFSSNPDVPRDAEPLAHFLEFGRFERRQPHPDIEAETDIATRTWSSLNTNSLRRTNLLMSSVGENCQIQSPAQAARTAFLKAAYGVKAVTFDIFDTLVERKTGRPETVFALLAPHALEAGFVGENFIEVRQAAELAARKNAGEREVTLAEIYSEFAKATKLSLDTCLALSNIESSLEIELCEEKAIGRMLYETARSEGVSINLLSDIYLPQTTIESILAKVGITGYSNLLVSSEIGATKHYGGMFDMIIDTLDIEPDEILHIGDNPHSDVTMPRSKGMRALLLQKSDAMSGAVSLVHWFRKDPAVPEGFWKAMVAGNLIYRESQIHGEQSSEHDTRVMRMYGAQSLGPVLLAFAQWMARQAKLLGYKRLYFASRDGFYLKEAFDQLRKYDPSLPETSYLLASRKVCRAACVRTLDDMLEVASIDHYPMAVRQFLQVRLLLTDTDLKALPSAALDRVVKVAKTDTDLHKLIEELQPIILQRCSEHSEAYLAYLRSLGLNEPGSVIVDIGYRGTVQRNLSDLLGTAIDGLYFVTWPAVSGLLSKGLRYSTFMASSAEPSDPLVRYVQLLELLMSGTHGSISHFEMSSSGHGQAVMLEPDTHPTARHTLNALRGGALEFMNDVLQNSPALMGADVPTGRDALNSLIEFFQTPSPLVVQGLANHVFEDLFGGETRSLVVSPKEAGSLSQALTKSCWHEGTLALWKRSGVSADQMKSEILNDTPDQFEGSKTFAGATLN